MRKNYCFTVAQGQGAPAADFLAARTGISKSRLKDAMNKGAVRLQRGSRQHRLRRATTLLAAGDRIELFYDEELLSRTVLKPVLVHDAAHYSVWNKPAGMLTQGTEYGDHCSLLRQVELAFNAKREVFPVHRLDREASGLVLVAHTKQAAARLSEMFQKQQVEKTYRVTVLGIVGHSGVCGAIDQPLDGKPARSTYCVASIDEQANATVLLMKIATGRLHQIRRHCAMIGHPVLGDPKYGKGNKNTEGMCLQAVSLSFRCPFGRSTVSFTLTE